MRLVRGGEAVEFVVHEYGRPVVCRVSRECIDDHMGNPRGVAARLAAAKAYFNEITDCVGDLIGRRRYESDRTILVRSADYEDRPR
jgi:hypothetical protein